MIMGEESKGWKHLVTEAQYKLRFMDAILFALPNGGVWKHRIEWLIAPYAPEITPLRGRDGHRDGYDAPRVPQ